MKINITWIAVLLLLTMFGMQVDAARIWVSPSGNDQNIGTKESPMLTLSAALRKARELRRLRDTSVTSGVYIILRGGDYLLSEAIFIRPEDSGSESSPTVIENAPDENPVLSGGVGIRGWSLLTSKVAGLPANAIGKVYVADLPSVNGMPLLFRQLWINGNKAVRARESNTDVGMQRILSVDKQKQELWIPLPKNGLPANPAQMEMVIHQMWAIANLRIKSITKEDDRAKLTFEQPESRIEFEHPWPPPVIDKDHKMNGNSAFYLANHLSFLDQPGEWYADIKQGKIYYWPRKGESMSSAKVVAPVLEKLVEIKGTLDRPVSHVYFKGISFEYASWLRPSLQGHVPLQSGMYMLDAYKLKVKGTPEKAGLENQAWIGRPSAAVEVSNANHTRFNACTFTHLASTGLDYLKGTHDDEINGNLFTDIGGTGIQIGTFSDEGFETHLPYNPSDLREVCQDERITNNLITNVTNEDWGTLGISAGYVKNVSIEHNEICEVGYTGISVGWGWTKNANVMSHNIIRFNRIHHYAKHMYDVAGIYTLSAQPGTIVSDNYVDSIYKVPYAHDPKHWFYLYTDEGSSNITVKNNWTPAEKFLQNANGPGNVWENNGPAVSEEIKTNAGLQPQYNYLLPKRVVNPQHQEINHATKPSA